MSKLVQIYRRILRMRALPPITGVSRSTMYSWLNPNSPNYDPTFPKPIRLGANSVGWDSCAIDSWIETRISASLGNSMAREQHA